MELYFTLCSSMCLCYMAKPHCEFSFFLENAGFPQPCAREPGTETFPGSAGLGYVGSGGLNTKALEKQFGLSVSEMLLSVKGRNCLNRLKPQGWASPVVSTLLSALGRPLLSCMTMQALPSLSTAHK